MRKWTLALVLFSLLPALVMAQTVDEIIQKYANAMGGLDAFNKIQSAKITGSLMIQGNEMALTIQIVNGKSVRSDVEVNGQAITSVYNNGTGWRINPFMGATTAEELTGADLYDTKSQAYLASQLMDYKAHGHQVELVGTDTVDGAKVYKIKLTYKEDGRVNTLYINSSNYLLVKSVIKREVKGTVVDIETDYSDFKEFGGAKFSTARIQKMDGNIIQEIHLDKIELNVPVDPKIFDMPK